MPTQNGWNENKKLILFRLNQQDKDVAEVKKTVEEILKHVQAIRVAQAVQSTKIGVISALSGAIAGWSVPAAIGWLFHK